MDRRDVQRPKPAVIAVVIVALQKIAGRALRGPVQSAVAVVTFVAMFFFDISLLVVMLGAVVLGIVLGALRPGLLLRPTKQTLRGGRGELLHSPQFNLKKSLTLAHKRTFFVRLSNDVPRDLWLNLRVDVPRRE